MEQNKPRLRMSAEWENKVEQLLYILLSLLFVACFMFRLLLDLQS